MPSPDLEKYRYRVDSADVLVWVDSWWLAFAQENGATQLTQQSVIGRSLWEFVSGDETRRCYSEIHDCVRNSGRPAVLVYRCDAPSLRRHMRMTITRENDQLLYESVLTRAETRRHLSLLDARQPRSDGSLAICSVCNRALLEPAGWLDLEELSIRLRLFDRRQVPGLYYTVCPECANMMKVASSN